MEQAMSRSASSPVTDALAAALVLAIGMGFGRFAFTGMYPLMVHEEVLTVQGGSLAASINYVGYLVGALMMSRVAHVHSARIAQLAMIGTVACLAALTLKLGVPFVLGIRFAAGVLTALAMVAASMWLFQTVGYQHGAPVLYAGVGSGIFLSAELIAAGRSQGFNSAAIWAMLAAAAAILCVMAWMNLSREPQGRIPEQPLLSDSAQRQDREFKAWVLIPIYGLAGFGYIITATYLPLFVRNAVGSVDPIQIWAAFGLGAAPSCFLWHALHHRLGSRRALTLNLIVQAVGVVLPMASASGPAFLASAFLVGGTFVGTVTIALPAAKRAASALAFNIMAMMTAAYGVGQIAGPLVSNALLGVSPSFNLPLLAAGVALIAAALGCLL